MCTNYKCFYILKWQIVVKEKQDHDNGKRMHLADLKEHRKL